MLYVHIHIYICTYIHTYIHIYIYIFLFIIAKTELLSTSPLPPSNSKPTRTSYMTWIILKIDSKKKRITCHRNHNRNDLVAVDFPHLEVSSVMGLSKSPWVDFGYPDLGNPHFTSRFASEEWSWQRKLFTWLGELLAGAGPKWRRGWAKEHEGMETKMEV
jgi:hypothetical protein